MTPQRKILIIHTGPFSQTLLLLQVMDTLHHHLSNVFIHLVSSEAACSFFKAHPLVEKTHPIEGTPRFKTMKVLLPHIKKEGYSVCLCFDNHLFSGLLGWLGRIPIRIGPKDLIRGWAFTHRIPHSKRPEHFSEYANRYLSPFQFEFDSAHSALPLTEVDSQFKLWANKRLSPSKKTLCVYWDTQMPQWESGLHHLVESAKDRGDLNLILCSSSQDPLFSTYSHTFVLNLAGKIGIQGVTAALRYSDMVLSTNLATIQLARILRKPLVAVMEETPWASLTSGPMSAYMKLETYSKEIPLEPTRLWNALTGLEHDMLLRDELTPLEQSEVLALHSYKVLYLAYQSEISQEERNQLLTLSKEGLSILPFEVLGLMDLKSLLTLLRSHSFTVIQGHVPWALEQGITLYYTLFRGFKPLFLQQKCHRFITLKEYLTLYHDPNALP